MKFIIFIIVIKGFFMNYILIRKLISSKVFVCLLLFFSGAMAMELTEFVNIKGKEFPVKTDRVIKKDGFYTDNGMRIFFMVNEDGSISKDKLSRKNNYAEIKRGEDIIKEFDISNKYEVVLIKGLPDYYIKVFSYEIKKYNSEGKVVFEDFYEDLSEKDQFLVKTELTAAQVDVMTSVRWYGQGSRMDFFDELNNQYRMTDVIYVVQDNDKGAEKKDEIKKNEIQEGEIKVGKVDSGNKRDNGTKIIPDADYSYKYWICGGIFVGVLFLVFFMKFKR